MTTKPRAKLARPGPVYEPTGSAIAREVAELRDRFRRLLAGPGSRLFNDPFAFELPETFQREFPPVVAEFPPVEMSEEPAEFLVTAELPGVKLDDITVEFAKGVLTLKGEKTVEREETEEQDEERKFHLYERSYGTFLRTFPIPGPVDEGKIAAEFKDGVLTIHLPKSAEAKAAAHRIPVAAK
jgi:HSP20 family protein